MDKKVGPGSDDEDSRNGRAALSRVLSLYRSDRLKDARRECAALIKAEPENFAARHLLAIMALRAGDAGEAVKHAKAALELDPHSAQGHNTMGAALQAEGKLFDAEDHFRKAVNLDPNLVAGYRNYLEALRLQNRLTPEKRKSVEAGLYTNLGNTAREKKNFPEARAYYEKALALKPEFTGDLHYNLGLIAKDENRTGDAERHFAEAIRRSPQTISAYRHLLAILKDSGRLNKEREIQLRTGYFNNYANLLIKQGKLKEAESNIKQALALDPPLASGMYSNLGNLYKARGEFGAAQEAYRKALKLDRKNVAAHSNLLFALLYDPASKPRDVLDEARRWNKQFKAPKKDSFAAQHKKRDSSPEKTLKIGFLSPDLGRHPVGYFLVSLVEHLEKSEALEVFCYSDRLPDDLSARMRASAHQWHDTMEMTDDDLAGQILHDGIDVLFDLAGHTGNNRLPLFARKPAPIQITWAGYPGTTGLEAMDYILADKWHIPKVHEKNFTEKVLRMPDGYVCFDPPPYAPDVGPLPLEKNKHVTFGCFNNTAKLNEPLVSLWGDILAALPESTLILKYRGFTDPDLQARIIAWFEKKDVGADRLIFEGTSEHREHLMRYNDIDIALDPFPYSGGLTTLEALWMGVPLITWPGGLMSSRHSLSHLSNVGVTDTIATSKKDYVKRAVSLAKNRKKLASLRKGLRKKMAASPACDGDKFAADFENRMRRIWRDRVKTVKAP